MKNALLALLGFLLLATPTAWAQTAPLGSGLYKSAEAFRQHRLTLGVDCKNETHKLRFHEFAGRPYVTVKHEGKVYQMAKDSLFGYRDCDGIDYRFASRNQHYSIVNPSEELLFYKEEVPVAGKYPIQPKRFFSPTAEAPMQPLTLLGIKKAFPENHRFHDLLDAQFPIGDLTAYDTMHRMTKVNWLLQQSRAAAAH